MAISLEKPALAVADNVIGNLLDEAGAGKFTVKVIDWTFTAIGNTFESTGHTDTEPYFENTGILYGTLRVIGAMVASQAINFTNIVNSTNNPATLTLNFGATRDVDLDLIVRSISTRFNRRNPWVGMVIEATMMRTALVEGALGGG